MNRTFDLLWLRIREYFGHPAEDVRQANPIVPGRLYTNFGYVCKAQPYSRKEREWLECYQESAAGDAVEAACDRVDLEHGRDMVNIDPKNIKAIQAACFNCELPGTCALCDFHRKSIPCPLYNVLKDGSVVCDTHKYVIIKSPR